MNHIMRKLNLTMSAAVLLFLITVVSPKPAPAQDLAEFEQQMTEFTLDNGLKFLVLERHQAPVVSFHTYADVGSVDEVLGITGLAHLFEHMAFKGTKTIGTNDYEAEAKVMAKIDELYDALKTEQRKGWQADKSRLEELQKQFKQAQYEAQQYMVHDEFEEVFKLAGSAGFNAYTSWTRPSISSAFLRIKSSSGC